MNLVVQRGEATDHPFKWEFPGGKLVPGETEEECIIREIDGRIVNGDCNMRQSLTTVDHDYGHKEDQAYPFYL